MRRRFDASPAPALLQTPLPRSGFTLIELLVVIAIVAVLLALAFPAIRGTVSAARGFRCQSSQRTIAFDFSVFADDQLHGSRGQDETDLQPGYFRIETFQESQYGIDEFWTYPNVGVYRVPDTQGRDPMRCAEVRGVLELRRLTSCFSGGVNPQENVSFGFNVRMHFSETRAAAGQPFMVGLTSRILDGYGLVSPSAIPLLADVDGAAAKAKGSSAMLLGPSLGATSVLANDRYWSPALRHSRTMNTAFVDGHVSAVRDPLQTSGCEWGFEPPQPSR